MLIKVDSYTQNSRNWHQIYAPSAPYEGEVARRWWSLPLNCLLPLTTGDRYRLIFPGRPGGSTGPDVRDAVLLSNSYSRDQQPPDKLFGDIEFHVRSSDWRMHRHSSDPRYNAVILHVVLICDDPYPTLRQDGISIPVCSLYDLPNLALSNAEACQALQSISPLNASNGEVSWPCQRILAALSDDERHKLLTRAGLLRFEQKTHSFVEQLHAISPEGLLDDTHSPYDLCLIPALAEGLGYGRDRELFRAIGLRLLQKQSALPEPLGHTEQPAPLDVRRLSALAQILKRWSALGVWQTLRTCLLSEKKQEGDESNLDPTILTTLRGAFTSSGLSLARADILIVNVVLPFAAAIALLEHDSLLAWRAQDLYMCHPGLTSNAITRAMARQLQLSREPAGSCCQQGLHYIYQQTCREKHCSTCMMGKMDV